MKALRVYVYRNALTGDCTNGGPSAFLDTLLVLCPEGYIDIDENNPPSHLMQVVRRIFAGKEIYHLEPVAAPKGAGWMFGGNYAGASDGRFTEMIGGTYGAVPIHDRDETWEQYEANFD